MTSGTAAWRGRRARGLPGLVAALALSAAACVAGSPPDPGGTPAGGGSHRVPEATTSPVVSAASATASAPAEARSPAPSPLPSVPPSRAPDVTPGEPSSTPSATAPAATKPATPAGMPAALLAGPAGDPVAGALGSYAWGGVASDTPWLPAAVLETVEVPAGAVVTVRVDGGDVERWSASAAPAEAGPAAAPEAVADGRGPRISFTIPDAGDLVVAVSAGFAGGGDATWYWHLVVR